MEPTFALPASFPDTLAPSDDTTTAAAVCLHDSLEASIDPLLEAEPVFGGDTGAWVGGHQSVRKDESRHGRAKEVTGSALELKYFGSLAAGAAKEAHCTSAGGEGNIESFRPFGAKPGVPRLVVRWRRQSERELTRNRAGKKCVARWKPSQHDQRKQEQAAQEGCEP